MAENAGPPPWMQLRLSKKLRKQHQSQQQQRRGGGGSGSSGAAAGASSLLQVPEGPVAPPASEEQPGAQQAEGAPAAADQGVKQQPPLLLGGRFSVRLPSVQPTNFLPRVVVGSGELEGGVKVGGLLGRGSAGGVYIGQYQGQSVAVKRIRLPDWLKTTGGTASNRRTAGDEGLSADTSSAEQPAGHASDARSNSCSHTAAGEAVSPPLDAPTAACSGSSPDVPAAAAVPQLAQVESVARVSNPHVMAIHQATVDKGELVLVTELAANDLFNFVHRQFQGRVPLVQVGRIAHQVRHAAAQYL